MKVVIIGGHFTPALAVIEQMPRTAEVLYVGRKYTFEKDKTVSLEYRTITGREIPFVDLKTGRLQRSLSAQTVSSLAKIPPGFLQAFKILKTFQPDVVIGFGGYLSLPVCLAARILNIPFVIHEQTLNAGMSNKILARFATKICISWNSSARLFPKEKTVLTGNPLPQSMFENMSHVISNEVKKFSKDQEKTKITRLPRRFTPRNDETICIVGGSAGSHAVNILVEGCLPQLLEHYNVIHQTGDAQEFGDFDRLEKLRKSLPQYLRERYTVSKFIQPEAFVSIVQKAELVVSRAGINTVTILLLLRKPSLLIPLPIGQHNEQYENAMLLQQCGLADIAEQHTLTPKILFDKISFMLDNRKKYHYVSQQKEKEANPLHSAQKIVTLLYDIAQG